MTLIQAISIALIFWVIVCAESWLAYPMINTPLVLCPIVGAILGNFELGITSGATLQLIFLGTMGIGGTIPADASLGSIVGTSLAITTGQSVEIALTFAVPISLLGSTFTFLRFMIITACTPITRKFAKAGNQRALTLQHMGLAFFTDFYKYIILALVLYIGNDIAESIIALIPQSVIDGMDFATGLMPAVGIALLLKTMWNKSMAVYFFFGVVLACFFAQGTLSVALVGVIVAVIIISMDTSKEKQVVAMGTAPSDDGGLFND